MQTRKTMLVVLDGWGWREEKKYNAVASAKTPNFDRYKARYPFTTLQASGLEVGLPAGMMGNSEVGHLNLGAGRVVWQEVTRINKSIAEGEFLRNHAFLDAMSKVRASGGRLHLMGLVSDGGVHSYELHYFTLLELARDQGMRPDRVIFHAITDGRDTPPISGLSYIRRLEGKMKETGVGRIGSIVGRYYAMDRDRRWDRLEKAYRAYALGEGHLSDHWEKDLQNSYASGVTDEFVLPIMMAEDGKPFGTFRDGDAVIFFNFRADRGREISYAFTDPAFSFFERPARPRLHWVCMTLYDPRIPAPVAFPPQRLGKVFGEHISNLGLTQLRIAETEKYAHVTYFFNGGREEAFPGEERLLVPSPRVARYNTMPEMSAREVSARLLEKIRNGPPDFILVNFANPDMVGHTGDFDAAVKAVETADEECGKVVDAFLERGGAAFLTADHGNAELMFDEELDEPHTAHTTFPVPAIFAGAGLEGRILHGGGRLCDVVATLAPVMGVALSPEMEGRNLLSDPLP